jgi:hypothetical protein
MNDRPKEARFPSLDEFAGWYNLGYERNDGHDVLHSQDHVPEFEHSEFFQLYVEEREWFEQQLIPAADSGASDPLAGPPMFVRSQADDRTLEVYPNFKFLTPDVLRRIQRGFLARHPLWRVLLGAEKPSCSIMIYPTVVRFGNLPPDTAWQEGLDCVATQAIALAEERLRPQRQEVVLLENRLPGAIESMGSRPFQLLAVRDQAIYDAACLAVFLVFRGSESYEYELEGPPGCHDDFLATSSAYGVSTQGKVISQITVPKTAAFHVRQWLPLATYRGPLTLTNSDTGEQHTIEIRNEDIARIAPD